MRSSCEPPCSMSWRVASAVRKVGVCGRKLCYCVGIVHLEEKIADPDLLKNLNVDLSDDSGRRGICLKFIDRLDFSVGRYGADKVLTSDCAAR